MLNRSVLRTISFMTVAGLLLAGCGTQAAPKTNAAAHTPAPQRTSPSASSTAPSPSTTSPSPSSPSASPTITTSAPVTSTETPPVPAGAGAYTSLGVHVTSVTSEGTATSSGKRLNLYRIGVSVYNPTSSVVTLALNDFTVDPAGSTAYSWNDYVTTGVSSSTSLFPYPLDPDRPGATTLNVFPDATKSGYVTVEVPSASQYQLTWNTGSTSPQPEASFKP